MVDSSKTFLNQLDVKASTVSRNTRRSADWLTNKLKKANVDKKNLVNRPRIGHMYMYVYSPKHKATLPYWDRNPLILCLDVKKDGWLGYNLHYIAPKLRAILLGKLLDLTNNKKMDRTTKLRLSYGFLKSASKYKQLKPTIKRYLSTHVVTKLIFVPANEWEEAVTLPTARFVGKSNSAVYSESRKKF